MALSGLRRIGAEQSIPKRKAKAVITIGLGLDDGMMDAVHVGG